MIFSDRGRKKTNFLNGKDPMSYSPDGKYIKHFEVPSPTAFVPYDGQKSYSIEKSNPKGLFFDQDSKGKEHDKMKQEYYDYCQYMMSLGKQPKSQQQYHNDIMNLAARPSTRDLKQAKQKLYAQELQRQIDDKNKQRFSSQPNRSPVNQQYIGVSDNEVQVVDFKHGSDFFMTPAKKTYGGSGDPIYDEYGQINANIRGISDKLHQGNSISYSPMRNNNKNVKGSRSTLGEGYFQEHKISNLKSQLKKQQQLQHQMEQEGKSIMDKMFERQEERQMNRQQRNNEYFKDIERQMQPDQNIFSNPLTQQDKLMKMADDYHQLNNQQMNQQQQAQKSIFQEMSDDNQKRKARRDMQMDQYNNDLQEQIELKKQQKKIQNDIDKMKEQKEEEKLQKERDDMRKQMEEEAKRRKKLLQDTDQDNQKIIEQQKKLQKNQEKLQEKQNNLITEALEMQNILKSKAATEARRSSQPTLEVPKTFSHMQHIPDTQSPHNQGLFSQSFQQNQLPSTINDQYGVSAGIYPINSQPFNHLKQKPSQYPPISAINPIQKLYNGQEKKDEHGNAPVTDEIVILRRELQNQTQKIQSDLLKIREDMQKQQAQSDHSQNQLLSSQEHLITYEMAKIEDQLKKQQAEIISAQAAQIAAATAKPTAPSQEEKEKKQSDDFLKQAQDDMIKQLQEQQRLLVEEHKNKLQEERYIREINAQKHANLKAIQDINVELQKKDIKEEMRFKILKNKIKEIDKTQTNTLLLKTAMASLQQTPRSSALKGEKEDQIQNKHNLTYHEGDASGDWRNNPIIQQHFHHNNHNNHNYNGQQSYNTHRQMSSPNSPQSQTQKTGFNTERKIADPKRQSLLSQHFHYDIFSTPRRPLSSQQRKKSQQPNLMISSAIQTNMVDYKDSEFQVDSKMFVREVKPQAEQECRKKKQCSKNSKTDHSQFMNQQNNQSPSITLPIVKRRESVELGRDQEETARRKKNKLLNQTYHNNNGYSNTSTYIDAWNNTAINQQVNPYQDNSTMNDYLNNTMLTSPQPFNPHNNTSQQNNKKYPHSLYQSTYKPKSKLRSSSLLTDKDDKQNQNSLKILENSNVINRNLDILDAIVKASNQNRTKSSQQRSVSRYLALTQKELQRESDTPSNYYSPTTEDNYIDLGVDYNFNASPSPQQLVYSSLPNTHAYSRNTPWKNRLQKNSPQNINIGPAHRVINQLDDILSDIKSGNLPQRKEVL